MRLCSHRAHRVQRGQALTESLVLVIVLVPLAIAIEQLSRLAMVQHQLIASVRHVLLETHFLPASPSAVPSSPTLRTTEERLSGPDSVMAKHLRSLSDNESAPRPRYEWSDLPLAPDAASVEWNLQWLATISAIGDGGFLGAPDVAKKISATLPVAITRGIGGWLEGDDLRYQESLTLLTDTWQVDSQAMLAHRVGSFTVTARLAEIAEPLRVMSRVLSVIEPSFDRFCPGRLVLETVPEDRLAVTGGPLYDFRNMPC